MADVILKKIVHHENSSWICVTLEMIFWTLKKILEVVIFCFSNGFLNLQQLVKKLLFWTDSWTRKKLKELTFWTRNKFLLRRSIFGFEGKILNLGNIFKEITFWNDFWTRKKIKRINFLDLKIFLMILIFCYADRFLDLRKKINWLFKLWKSFRDSDFFVLVRHEIAIWTWVNFKFQWFFNPDGFWKLKIFYVGI